MKKDTSLDKITLLRLAFQELDEKELEKMAAFSKFHTYEAGQVLCCEGAYEDTFYIIADGTVRITQDLQDDGGERLLRMGEKGSLVGEMALIQNAPRSATVRTVTPCTTLEMKKADFEHILQSSPRMANDIVRITLDRFRTNDQTAIADLQKTNKMLRQLDRNKLEFIQVAAHELRTPLTVLKGYVDLLQSLPDFEASDTLQEVLAGITSGADRMYEVVNMMLDISRIDDEMPNLNAVPVLVKQTINSIVKWLDKDASHRKIKINVHHAKDVPIIHAEPDMIRKALYHLIVNAIKYTPDGGKVKISTALTKMDGNIPAIEIVVQDTGIGLDIEHQELIFEKFYQVGSVAVHSSGKTNFKGGGSGLGLAIVRGVTRAHKGKVWVESPRCDEESCPGSTFYLQLPINPAF